MDLKELVIVVILLFFGLILNDVLKTKNDKLLIDRILRIEEDLNILKQTKKELPEIKHQLKDLSGIKDDFAEIKKLTKDLEELSATKRVEWKQELTKITKEFERLAQHQQTIEGLNLQQQIHKLTLLQRKVDSRG